MLSDLIHTPEFAAPRPGWLSASCLALSALLIATLAILPAQKDASPSTTIAVATH